jgi:catechol 2,3-dioxygenase-like lactoylglutathione lyase family enzyme
MKPAIVAPAMRFIGVAGADRSILFYRDILGFKVRDQQGTIEAVYGPLASTWAPRTMRPTIETPRPRGSAIIFFQTDDVAAMHAGIRARGGSPSELEKVNWIKMRMFEIRDPDGHTLWFGQSYDVPHSPAPAPMMRKALPELPCDNVAAAVAYYKDVLGFHINYQQRSRRHGPRPDHRAADRP